MVWALCAQLYCTHWLRPRNPPPPHIRGPYWFVKIDDISMWPPEYSFYTPHFVFKVLSKVCYPQQVLRRSKPKPNRNVVFTTNVDYSRFPLLKKDLKESILAELSASGSQIDLSSAGGGPGGGGLRDERHYVTLDDVAPFKHLRRKASNESAVSSWATEERWVLDRKKRR